MRYKHLLSRLKYLRVWVVVVISLGLFQGCNPKIFDFTATPRTIGSNDNIQVNWSVRGTPTLLIHDKPLPGSDTTASLRELTLVVKKNGRETSRLIQIAILPNGFTDKIVFSTTALKGDTLIAAGINSAIRWGDSFVIQTVSPGSNRPITVIHEGRTLQLDPSSKPVTTFQGTSVKGQWEFRSLLTPSEKLDHRLAPNRLEIFITVQHQ